MTATRAFVGSLVIALSCGASHALPPDQVEGWRQDLAVARQKLAEIHPAPWRRVSKEDVEGAFADLERRLPALSPPQAAVALGEIIASLGDGHSRLTLPIPFEVGFVDGHSPTEPPAGEALRFHTLPIRLGIYEEGVFVERVAGSAREIVGARVVAIGGRPIDEAMTAVEPVVRHDNRSQLLDLLPMHLVIPEVLAARGLSRDPRAATFTFALPGGDRREVRLAAEEPEAAQWVSAFDGRERIAASFRHLKPGLAPRRGAFTKPYWFARLAGTRTTFLQYNLAEDEGSEHLLDFAARLRGELASGEVDRLIVDLRWNWGGDNSASRPLLHALIASEVLREPGALLVLIGRGTFSAGMMFASDLERHLRPVFVGEPTGSPPNHAGDARKVRLPYTGLTLRYSTLWWQYGDPRDERHAIAPHLPSPPRWTDLVAGRDGALEAILGRPATVSIAGRWVGLMTPPTQSFPLDLTIELRDGKWHGRLSAGELGTDLEVSDLARDGDRVSFRVDRERGDLAFAGVLLDDRLAGRVIYANIRAEPIAFGLQRRGASETTP